jgi:hypothetical protein
MLHVDPGHPTAAHAQDTTFPSIPTIEIPTFPCITTISYTGPSLEPRKREPAVNAPQKRRTFDLIRDAVLPEFRDRVDDYLETYAATLQNELCEPADRQAAAQQLRGFLRGLNTTRVLGMADWEELDRRVVESWL